MTRGIEEIEIKEEKTLSGLVEELQLTATPVLLEVNGEVFYRMRSGTEE
jgi:sulfur carrier protein ThiS